MAHTRPVFAFVSSLALVLAAAATAAPKGTGSAGPASSNSAPPAAPAARAAGAATAHTSPATHGAAPATHGAPPAPSTPAASSAAATESTPPAAAGTADDRAALASRVALLERAGKPLALGVILNEDGRILASLSSLGGSHNVDARYADKKVVPLRVGHADRAHDLALLVPANSEHKLGLKAARDAGAALHAALGAFSVNGDKAAPGPMLTPVGPSSFATNDGKPYPEALGFKTAPSATTIGSPLVDANGEVVAIVTRACQKKPGAGCTPVLVGTPVTLVREFLHSAPKTAAIPTPSLGFQAVPDDAGSARGLRVTAVRGSGATLGLRAGADAHVADVIVALDGVPVTTSEAFERIVEDHAVGDVVDLLVLGAGRYRHVTVVVGAAPR